MPKTSTTAEAYDIICDMEEPLLAVKNFADRRTCTYKIAIGPINVRFGALSGTKPEHRDMSAWCPRADLWLTQWAPNRLVSD
jgi:hypothetical protein